MTMSSDLSPLRRTIDEIDAAIIDLLAKRMEVCREVAAMKAGSGTPVIQPARVREVLTSRRQWAIDKRVDADFAEQLFRIVLSETHRIEVAHERHESAPDKLAGEITGALDTVAVRIDHVVVCVANLDSSRPPMRAASPWCWWAQEMILRCTSIWPNTDRVSSTSPSRCLTLVLCKKHWRQQGSRC
jgi:chorismate mutase-like protein